MTTIMIVRAEDVRKTPKAFQQYVADWFAPKNILGLDCLWASGLLFLDSSHHGFRGRQPGYAPTHGVDTRSYKEGLPKDMDLNGWMRKNNGKLVWLLDAAEERSMRCIDDD